MLVPECHHRVVCRARSDESAGAPDEILDIGEDSASPTTSDDPRGETNAFTGTINWVQIDLEDDDVSHMEDPEQTYHRIMARQ